MGRKFDIPIFYRSNLISTIKNARRVSDHRKQDLTPSVLDLGRLRFKIARLFGFCFGVENAIDIAYRALEENPTKRVFLLSEMIHNPHVNSDLRGRGVRFILSPDGEQLVPFGELNPDDIVIVPAFGTTVELFQKLHALGINPARYNATCPFVEKVWKRAEELGKKGYTVIIHGKHYHEETRATFSHASLFAPSLVIRDMNEAALLVKYIRKESSVEQFQNDFAGRYSNGFDPSHDLERIGVVNQTTMLAPETQAISSYLKDGMRNLYGERNLAAYFADTRDTLCYATSENQDAVQGLVDAGGDVALVVGGYNSSNTSHLVKLCEKRVRTFYIKDADEILSINSIRHLSTASQEVIVTQNWLPLEKNPIDILLTAGASCPDALVEAVIRRIASIFNVELQLLETLKTYERVPAETLRTVNVSH